jgi:hypothetical protein
VSESNVMSTREDNVSESNVMSTREDNVSESNVMSTREDNVSESNVMSTHFFLFLVFNATFSNILAISWRPVLVVEEGGENHRPWASNW